MDTPPVTEPHFPARLVLLADNNACGARLQTGKDTFVTGPHIQAALKYLVIRQPVIAATAREARADLLAGHPDPTAVRLAQPRLGGTWTPAS